MYSIINTLIMCFEMLKGTEHPSGAPDFTPSPGFSGVLAVQS